MVAMSLPRTLMAVKGVDHDYPGGVEALSGVDFTITHGRNLALLGPNGAGKSTLLMHLNGLLRPRRGAILLDGKPVSYRRSFLREWRSRVGFVFQNPDEQIFAATVADEIAYGPANLGLNAGEIAQRVETVMNQLDLHALSHRPPHMLSLGQKKRVAIAGVVAMNPELLILDEPTAGLDHKGVTKLLAILSDIKALGKTVVLSTHDVDLAYGWADDAALFSQGAVIAQGEAETVLTDGEQMAAAGLPMPVAWAVMNALGVDDRVTIPRNREQLMVCCSRLKDRDAL
ncbi:MAG: ABC transporter ATP-binding protein [Magnetococcales bacterium]|nr:ABC transporter ATP-binding protein [Magnetococcales bacterium]